MNAKLVTPDLGSLDDDPTEILPPAPRPELRVPPALGAQGGYSGSTRLCDRGIRPRNHGSPPRC